MNHWSIAELQRVARYLHNRGVEILPGQVQCFLDVDTDTLVQAMRDEGFETGARTDRELLFFAKSR
jgi:hypothetical protein